MSEDTRDVGFPEWWSVGSLEMWENTAICSVLMPSSIDIYVAAARTYVLHVRVKMKMFQYISGTKLWQHVKTAWLRVFMSYAMACGCWKKANLLRLWAKMPLLWFYGPRQPDSQPFFFDHMVQTCHRGFLKASVRDTKPDIHFTLWQRNAPMMRAKPGALFK